MLIGFGIPMGGPLATPASIARIARGGEALGYGFATFSDHLVMPTDIQARYPYSDTGEYPKGGGGERHEQLTTAMFVAAKTSTLQLITSVMVVPHRPAVLTAKTLSTIDVLSGGRLTVGIGAGWLREEFEAIGAPPFEARGRVTDEYVAACRALWTEENPTFAGEFVRFSDVVFAPKPSRSIPIWVGGESGPALRRAARSGDGWYPIGTNPQHPLDSLARYQAAVGRLRKLAAEAGRPAGAVALAYRVHRHGAGLPALADDGERRAFSGGAAEIAADMRAFRDLGVVAMDFGFGGACADAVLDEMKRFQDDVVSLL